MSRKKANNYIPSQTNSRFANLGSQQLKTEMYVPQYALTPMNSGMRYPDSLQKFQWELESSFNQARKMSITETYQSEANKSRRRRMKTEKYNSSEEEEEEREIRKQNREVESLRYQIKELKTEMQQKTKYKDRKMEDKLDQLIIQLAKQQQIDKINSERRSQQPPPPMYPQMYPPYPPYPMYSSYNPHQKPEPNREPQSRKSYQPFKKPNKSKASLKAKLRKYFFVVTFTIFVRSQAKRLSTIRKNALRKFYLQKFDSQVQNIKNWLLDGHSHCLAVILEKQQVDMSFINEKKQQIKKQKQNLILKLILLGCQKMKQQCTPQKASLFTEVIFNICRRGSFAMSRFWTAYQMENVSVSEYYGFLRVDDHLEKALIGIFIFIKVLIFNMFLQPHKFDNQNFPKTKVVLKKNMYLIGSVYYRIVKELLLDYLEEKRSNYYKLGNWLEVKSQFIVECCEPLMFQCEYPEDGEFISGMLSEEHMADIKTLKAWSSIKARLSDIINVFHKEMVNKGANVRKNIKYKLSH